MSTRKKPELNLKANVYGPLTEADTIDALVAGDDVGFIHAVTVNGLRCSSDDALPIEAFLLLAFTVFIPSTDSVGELLRVA